MRFHIQGGDFDQNCSYSNATFCQGNSVAGCNPSSENRSVTCQYCYSNGTNHIGTGCTVNGGASTVRPRSGAGKDDPGGGAACNVLSRCYDAGGNVVYMELDCGGEDLSYWGLCG